MRPLRVAARIAGLLAWLAICLPAHGLARLFGRASPWPRRFLGGVGGIFGARVSTAGLPLRGPTLLLANHQSWLDILVLGGALGARFVSKDAVNRWPGVGFLARCNRTLFISREAKGSVLAQAEQLRAALADPQPMALFPEGTTSDGRQVLAFRPSLLAAACPGPPGLSVVPVAVDYGPATDAIAWHGDEPVMRNLLRVLGRRGTFPVRVTVLPPVTGADRKTLARAAEQAIADALLRPLASPPIARAA